MTIKRDPIQVVGYIRVSTDHQVDSGLGLDAQRAAIEARCASAGLELVEIVEDAGVSGCVPLEKRPGGKRLVELLEAGASGVMAVRLDRLFRSVADCLSTVVTWDEHGWALHLLDLSGQAVDTRSPMGRFMVSILAVVAALERDLIRERTRAAMQRLVAQGMRFGRVPYGCRLEGNDLVEVPEETVVIEQMTALRIGGMSYQGIATHLNEAEVPPPIARRCGKQSKQWYAPTIRHILLRHSHAPKQ